MEHKFTEVELQNCFGTPDNLELREVELQWRWNSENLEQQKIEVRKGGIGSPKSRNCINFRKWFSFKEVQVTFAHHSNHSNHQVVIKGSFAQCSPFNQPSLIHFVYLFDFPFVDRYDNCINNAWSMRHKPNAWSYSYTLLQWYQWVS